MQHSKLKVAVMIASSIIGTVVLPSPAAAEQFEWGPWSKTQECQVTKREMEIDGKTMQVTQTSLGGACKWVRFKDGCKRTRDKVLHPIECRVNAQWSGYRDSMPPY